MKNVFFNHEVLNAEKKIILSLTKPSGDLMEHAGSNSASYIIDHVLIHYFHPVYILTGKGNNAGDGFVIARYLASAGFEVTVLSLYKEEELKGDSLFNFEKLKKIKAEKMKIVQCNETDDLKKEINIDEKIIIDAIFGVGFKGEPDERMKSIIEFINDVKNKIVISVDVPSGLYEHDQKTICINADITLTMGTKKFAELFYAGKESSGTVEVMNIGVDENEFTKYNERRIFEIESNDVKKIIPQRKTDSNKYTNGKVFVLAGSKGLTGAAYLCSMAALRTGSGAVIAGIPESISSIMAVKFTEVMTMPLEETFDCTLSLKGFDKISEKIEWSDVTLIGPGISKNKETLELVRRIIKECDSHFVIDADAISAFKDDPEILRNRKIILTPHFGEFANLIGKTTDEIKNNFYQYAKDFSDKYEVTLVLKNAPTIIAGERSFYINSTGRENLATVGTGDVLSGIIASLYSQTKDRTGSAYAGVYLHGMCGDHLYETKGNSTIAGDLIDVLAEVKRKLKVYSL
ncbi:MAG: NAD(P)H-hydrate dehydratase [bacterium]